VNGRKAKELRWRFRFWFARNLNDDGIARQTGAPIRKVKRERHLKSKEHFESEEREMLARRGEQS